MFLSSIFHKKDIVLIDGGTQKRCFLYIDDAIDALLRILDNRDNVASDRIFNIGHPGNEASISELAEMMLSLMATFPGYENIGQQLRVTHASGNSYYGNGYQDIDTRVPSIELARSQLGWNPTTPLLEGLRKTIAHYYAESTTKLKVV
jgi:nucleoside-diphosphate-sugar epimerase